MFDDSRLFDVDEEDLEYGIPLDENDARLKNLRKQTFFLWMYVANEGLWEDAHDFVCEGLNRSGTIDYGF